LNGKLEARFRSRHNGTLIESLDIHEIRPEDWNQAFLAMQQDLLKNVESQKPIKQR
jgi:hypothetical protein